jgi:hypothetical protein
MFWKKNGEKWLYISETIAVDAKLESVTFT